MSSLIEMLLPCFGYFNQKQIDKLERSVYKDSFSIILFQNRGYVNLYFQVR